MTHLDEYNPLQVRYRTVLYGVCTRAVASIARPLVCDVIQSITHTLPERASPPSLPFKDVADFATLVATYTEGFSVIIEPQGSNIPGLYQPSA